MISIGEYYYSPTSPACLVLSINVRKDGANNKCKLSAPKVGKKLRSKKAKPNKTQKALSIQQNFDNYYQS